MLAAQLSDDQMALIGCAVVFAGCIVMMIVSQKIGESVRGKKPSTRERIVPFPAKASRADEHQTPERHAA